MPAQTVGSAAVVLTANADGLLAGLHRAERATEQFAGRATKAAARAGGKGGVFGSLFGGLSLGGGGIGAAGGAGAALAVIGAAANAAIQITERFIDRLSQVGERAKEYSGISPETQAGIDRATAGFARIDAAVDALFFRLAGDLAPVIERVADVLEVVGFVAGKAFGVAADLASEVYHAVLRAIDSTTDWSVSTTTAGDAVFNVLRFVGKGFAYLWDTIKAGSGIVLYVAGTIVEAYGEVVSALGKAIKFIDKIAKELPDAIRPEWVGKLGTVVDGWGAGIAASGEKLALMGKAAIKSFGASATAVDIWFNTIQAAFAAQEKLQKKAESSANNGPLLAGAFLRNSADSVSVLNKFQGSNQVADSQKRQTDLLRVIAKNQEIMVALMKQSGAF